MRSWILFAFVAYVEITIHRGILIKTNRSRVFKRKKFPPQLKLQQDETKQTYILLYFRQDHHVGSIIRETIVIKKWKVIIRRLKIRQWRVLKARSHIPILSDFMLSWHLSVIDHFHKGHDYYFMCILISLSTIQKNLSFKTRPTRLII